MANFETLDDWTEEQQQCAAGIVLCGPYNLFKRRASYFVISRLTVEHVSGTNYLMFLQLQYATGLTHQGPDSQKFLSQT